ncbi:MAG TPA: antitoxin Xre-like helix-turn-helix domain-containing protein [Gemmatimonadaceae bacterium]|nr:antitoxin Xre-like helix-turn-helix domain-containing protein [Gemmatimonadaceae bacterium]
MAAAPSRKHAGAHRSKRWSDLLSRRAPLAALNSYDPMERIALVREGVPAELVPVVAEEMAISRERLYRTIGVPRATMDRKIRARQRLNPDESERLLGIARLVGQVEQMVRESGEPENFDSARWLADWLETPLAALGGSCPAALMDTAEGRRIVSDLLAQMQSGAYA